MFKSFLQFLTCCVSLLVCGLLWYRVSSIINAPELSGLIDDVMDFARGHLGEGIALDYQTGVFTVRMPLRQQQII